MRLSHVALVATGVVAAGIPVVTSGGEAWRLMRADAQPASYGAEPAMRRLPGRDDRLLALTRGALIVAVRCLAARGTRGHRAPWCARRQRRDADATGSRTAKLAMLTMSGPVRSALSGPLLA